MEFQILTSIEKLTHVALQGFEGQIRILHLLGPSHDRTQHIENLKRMLDYLARNIETDRNQLIESIEEVYSSIADELASQQEFASRAAASSNNNEVKKFSKELTEVQPVIIKTLGVQETNTEKEILQRFRTLLEKIDEMKKRVNQMRT